MPLGEPVVSQVQRIALLMGQDTGFNRQVLLGIRAFALSRKQWLLHNAPPEVGSLGPLREWHAHGIIAHLVDRAFTRAVLRLRRPVVDVACAQAGLKVPVVDVDHAAVGRLAAAHFLERGYRNYGYFGSATVLYSRMREASYRQALAAAGFAVAACHVDYAPRLPIRTSWRTVNRQIRQWLKNLRKPVAVLAANDVPARDLASNVPPTGTADPGRRGRAGRGRRRAGMPVGLPAALQRGDSRRTDRLRGCPNPGPDARGRAGAE
jgi:LacI family transcriptional regulator